MPDETQIPKVPEKTPAQAEAEKKLSERKEQIAKQKAEAEAAAKKRSDEIAAFKANIGKEFTGEKNGAIVGFSSDKVIGSKTGDAYIINLGNPHRFDYIHCETFNQQYKIRE
ncbi:MAG: hypothetical protein KGL39_10180 [Patescibacteria group bacterium]|nr:hypothetical protein [Patescibacteria group bacterium]